MLKCIRIAVCLFLIVLCIPLLGSNLKKVKQMTDGEIAALQLTIFSEIYWRDVVKDLDAPMMAVSDGSRIQMTIFGSRDNAEGARETIMNYMSGLQSDFLPYLEENFEIKLEIDDFKIVYRNRLTKKIKIILIYEDGEYKIP